MFKIVLTLIIALAGCSTVTESKSDNQPVGAKPANYVDNQQPTAKVTEVQVTGSIDNYTFAVTVDSLDTGCDRYADWWEVVTPAGELIYRRVLLHSHVDEQPFERTGGTVAIKPDQQVIVRVHMSPGGYSNQAQKGTVASGFTATTLAEDFAQNLAVVEPLPEGCTF